MHNSMDMPMTVKHTHTPHGLQIHHIQFSRHATIMAKNTCDRARTGGHHDILPIPHHIYIYTLQTPQTQHLASSMTYFRVYHERNNSLADIMLSDGIDSEACPRYGGSRRPCTCLQFRCRPTISVQNTPQEKFRPRWESSAVCKSSSSFATSSTVSGGEWNTRGYLTKNYSTMSSDVAERGGTLASKSDRAAAVLFCSGNIPTEIGGLARMERLQLNDNKLEGEQATILTLSTSASCMTYGIRSSRSSNVKVVARMSPKRLFKYSILQKIKWFCDSNSADLSCKPLANASSSGCFLEKCLQLFSSVLSVVKTTHDGHRRHFLTLCFFAPVGTYHARKNICFPEEKA